MLKILLSKRALHPLSLLRHRTAPKMSMSSYTTDKASPFTRAVVAAMRKLCVQASRAYTLRVFCFCSMPDAAVEDTAC